VVRSVCFLSERFFRYLCAEKISSQEKNIKQTQKTKQRISIKQNKNTKAKMQFIYQILIMCLCTFIGVMHAIPNPVALPHPEPETAIEERQLPIQGGPVDVSIFHSCIIISELTAYPPTVLSPLLPLQPRNRRDHLLQQYNGPVESRW
jgi:hypothetical protein